jgi:hypothetical protein
MTKIDYSTLYASALNAAQLAASVEDAKLGPEAARGLDCGFAWVALRPARGPFVSWLKAQGLGMSGYPTGWQLWGARLHEVGTQSVSVHLEACHAFACVLAQAGVPGVSVGSRLD